MGQTYLKGLEAKSLIVNQCLDLASIELTKGTLVEVRACPRLTWIRGKVTGDLTVEDCSELTNLDIVLPKDALPAPSIIVRRCSKLGTIGRVSGAPRTCKDVVVEDCESFRGFWPRLIVRGVRRVTGCPHWRESR